MKNVKYLESLSPAIYKGIDYQGEIVGKWSIVGRIGSYVSPTKAKHPVWKVICNDCQTEKESNCYLIIKGLAGCENCYLSNCLGINGSNWQGGKFVPMTFYSAMKDRIRKSGRDIPLTVTISDLDDQWELQQGSCVYTGIDLKFGTKGNRGTASIDRIDSKIGYEKNNVQFVHKDINIMKWDFSHERFVEICIQVADFMKNKETFNE